MNDQRVKTDNEVIAEFMGGTFEKREIMTVGGKRGGKWTFPNRTWLYDDQLRYSILWDHLMPVVQKIRTLFQDNKLFEKGKEKWSLIALCLETTEISSVYLAVVQFIRWYNNQQQPNDTENPFPPIQGYNC